MAMTIMAQYASFIVMRVIYSLFFVLFSFMVLAKPVLPVVIKVTIDDDITSVMADYIKESILFAQAKHAQALLIVLDTPGGLLEATRNIVKDMLSAHMPVIVYIGPSGARAGSAGVFITLAADVAAMAPSTHIGAAHPVNSFGGDIDGDMRKKVENDTVAWARSLAEGKNRNADWAEKAVRESVSISEKAALKEKVIDYIAKDVPALLARIDGKSVVVDGKKQILQTKDAQVINFEMSNQQKLLKWFSDPTLIFLFMLLGFLGLFLEFQAPGVSLPGIFGLLCLAFVFGLQLLPLNGFGVLLILGAIAFFIAEIYITSFGLLSLVGLGLFVLGSFLLFETPGSSLQVEPIMIWVFAGCMLFLIAGIGFLITRAKHQRPTSGVDAMQGKTAVVYEAIIPPKPGTIYMQGSYWVAYADETIFPDTQIKVVRMQGAHAYVEKI